MLNTKYMNVLCISYLTFSKIRIVLGVIAPDAAIAAPLNFVSYANCCAYCCLCCSLYCCTRWFVAFAALAIVFVAFGDLVALVSLVALVALVALVDLVSLCTIVDLNVAIKLSIIVELVALISHNELFFVLICCSCCYF